MKNVKIIKTPCRGQVAQRAYGLLRACQPLVLQLDDDIVLMTGMIFDMLGTKIGINSGMAMHWRLCSVIFSTGQYTITEYHARGISGWLHSLLCFFDLWSAMGH